LQALTSLNEPLFVEAAQALAWKTVAEGGRTIPERIQFAFRRVLNRKPTTAELSVLEGLYQRQLSRMAEGWVNPNELATGAPMPSKDLPAGVTPAQLAALTSVGRALLNSDEAITKE
jgi:hypothetical protein